jgi:hypothetical protein
MTLPKLLTISAIHGRLQRIFPEGAPNRNYCTRLIAARTIFAMLYIGAIEATGQWLAPKQVTRMSDTQAASQTDRDRGDYRANSMKPGFRPVGQRWYEDNTREPIRDETLKEGLARVGAVTIRQDIPTTSGLGRYALSADFAALFDPDLASDPLETAITDWQARHLSAGALMRIQIMRRGAVAAGDRLTVTFPGGEARQLATGPSSVISKAVIEEFAPRFLEQPAVIWLSESGNKVVARDDDLARSIGLNIVASRLLPDIILVDLGSRDLLLVFVEVVATDGPMSESRRADLLHLAASTRLPAGQIAFVTAYLDRNHPAFKRTVAALAWQSFAWFVAEPDHLFILRQGSGQRAARLADLTR